MKLTFNTVAREICKRDDAKGTGYDLRANHVSACIKHFEDILAENLLATLTGQIAGTPFVVQFQNRVRRKMEKARKSRRPDKRGR